MQLSNSFTKKNIFTFMKRIYFLTNKEMRNFNTTYLKTKSLRYKMVSFLSVGPEM